MPLPPASAITPVVFISYAHESDELRSAVKALADWLTERQCRVLTDHPYAYRAPAQGWQVWMMKCIREADTVLVVCTPRLKERYERTAAAGAGRGSTFEGALVTQLIYDEMMSNTKFHPILPDHGDDADIPLALRQWSNGHRFPSGRQNILELIRAPREPTDKGTIEPIADGGVPASAITRRHQEFVLELLSGAEVRPFLDTLIRGLRAEHVEANSAAEVVAHYAADLPSESKGDAALERFDYVRRALSVHARTEGARRASAALYCLAACSLVNREIAKKQIDDSGSRFVLNVPVEDDLILAVTATALFGGRLELQDDTANDALRGQYVLRVAPLLGGDWSRFDFERAMLATLSAHHGDTPNLTLNTGPLTAVEQNALRARLRSIRRTHRHAFALVVPGGTAPEHVRLAADRHQAPVLISSSVAPLLFGLDAGEFQAEVREFLREYRAGAAKPTPPADDARSGPATASPVGGVALHVSVENVVVASQVQHGADGLAELLPLLRDLLAAVQAAPPSSAKSALEAAAAAAHAEVAKGATANPGVFKRALDTLKSAKDGIEGGEKIAELCDKLLRVAGPFLAGLGTQL